MYKRKQSQVILKSECNGSLKSPVYTDPGIFASALFCFEQKLDTEKRGEVGFQVGLP